MLACNPARYTVPAMRRRPSRSEPVRTSAHSPQRRAPAPALEFAKWIVWEDAHLIAVDKPAGVLSQGGEGGEGINLVDLARAHLGIEHIGVLHRIDRNVSGIVLIAKDPRAARGVTIEMQKGRVERVYTAVVRGDPAQDGFRIDAWLSKDAHRNEVSARTAEQLDALPSAQRESYRPAQTDVRVESRWTCAFGRCATLEVRPVTGRSHQIRVHLAHVELPIVGDPKYGVEARGLQRPLLHARRIAFRHPITRAPVTIEAPLPWTDDLLRTLAPRTG